MHGISFTNGRAEMAYRGAKPWHGLGEILLDDDDLDTCTRKAGMGWEIRRSKVRYATNATPTIADFRSMNDRHVLCRSDTLEPLAIVSDGFQIVQPRQVMEFMRDLTEAAGFRIETAGVLHQGRKFWALARMGESAAIVGNDLIKAYLLVATSCDGSMATLAANVSERVVCANTLRIAMNEKGNTSVRVSHRSVFDADAVKKQLGICVPAFLRFVAEARELAKRDVSPVEAQTFVATMVDQPDLDKAREIAGFNRILSLFNGSGMGANLDGVRGTAWGLVNAVTEYVDHHARARSQSNRLDSAWFGAGDDMKQLAMNKAVALLAA